MSARRLAALAAVLAPILLGFAATLIWWGLDRERTVFAVMPISRIPLLIGAVLSALALAAALGAAAESILGRRERRRLLQDVAASRRRLMSRLDHEIKNPIQGIRAALADEPSDRQRASIAAQTDRLVGLLRDLRKIGEVEHMPLEVAPVDLAALAHEAIEAVREAPGAGERRFSASFPTAPRPLPPVRADEDLLFLALMNVLSNAVKYSRPGAAVEVRGRAEDDTVILEVADTGRGIPPEELMLVWEELGRASEARGIEGSGLGLPMVRAILERHDGSAELASWYGEGSTVTLRLPVGGPSRLVADADADLVTGKHPVRR